MKNYPSNITRQQFELIRPALENFRKRTKPRKYDLYEVFCAVLYVLKTGCQWRQVVAGEWTTVVSGLVTLFIGVMVPVNTSSLFVDLVIQTIMLTLVFLISLKVTRNRVMSDLVVRVRNH